MKTIIAILFCVAFFVSCSMPVSNQLQMDEVLINGIWGGWQIQTDIGMFKTPVGIKTVGYKVFVVLHDGQWYIWDNGYGMKIELIE